MRYPLIRSDGLVAWLLSGALAGQVGALVFGLAMWELDDLDSVASVARADDSFLIAVPVHLAIAAVVGAGFGALVWHQRSGTGETLLWGLTYGALWWFIGPLTLRPLLEGNALGWDVPSAQAAFAPFLGHLLYGAATGLALLALRRQRLRWPTIGALTRAAIAGLIALSIVGALLSAQDRLHLFPAMSPDAQNGLAWLATLAIGGISGIAFALLVPRPSESAGAGLIRGAMYGFLLWTALNRTILPLIAGDGLTWSVNEARADFAALFAYLLFGGALGLAYQWLDSAWRNLLADDVGNDDEEGPGTRGLRAIGRGAIAGVVGGLIFTYVMVEIRGLDDVADIVRADSEAAGLAVHFLIAVIWGVTYGLFFRRQTYDRGSAIRWGVSYGFFVWVLGPNTLMPILLGSTPDWTADSAAGLTASLVGHLAYGAALGITFHHFEAQHSPWWMPYRVAAAARVAQRREQVLTSAPALWALVVIVGLTLPVLLSTAAPAD